MSGLIFTRIKSLLTLRLNAIKSRQFYCLVDNANITNQRFTSLAFLNFLVRSLLDTSMRYFSTLCVFYIFIICLEALVDNCIESTNPFGECGACESQVSLCLTHICYSQSMYRINCSCTHFGYSGRYSFHPSLDLLQLRLQRSFPLCT